MTQPAPTLLRWARPVALFIAAFLGPCILGYAVLTAAEMLRGAP